MKENDLLTMFVNQSNLYKENKLVPNIDIKQLNPKIIAGGFKYTGLLFLKFVLKIF